MNAENWEAFKYLSKGGVEKEKFILAFDGKAQGLVYDNFDEPFFNQIKSSCDFPLQLERNYRNPNNIARKAALLIGEPEEKIEVAEGESLEDIKAKLKPKKSAISADMLDTANTYDDKVAIIRMIVGDEAGRVSSVFRNMMKQNANSEEES